MWRDLTSLPARLLEVTQLLRENNQLLRELIRATTGEWPKVPGTPAISGPRRKLTAQDVTYVTRASMAAAQERERINQARDQRATAIPDLGAPREPSPSPASPDSPIKLPSA